MSFDDTINAYFVQTFPSSNDDEAHAGSLNEFREALTLLRNHISDDHIRQLRASEGYALLSTLNLTKKDVFIFDRFEGDFFEQLQKAKSLIVGPRCLITCLLNCEPIPLGSSPVFTTAMRGLQISASGYEHKEKERIRELVQWMGGHFFQNLGRSVTHLISNTIKSTKYQHATLNGIAVMHINWIYNVWERSCLENIKATDDEYQKYHLPIFFGCNITCTGLENDEKEKIDRLVSENGGTFHRAFRSSLVDIVITIKSKTDTEKYKAAVRYKKEILLPKWIYDSVEKGYALPMRMYQVKSLKVSTPTKCDQSIADFTVTDRTQLSDISHISVADAKRTLSSLTINDTFNTNIAEKKSTAVDRFVVPSLPAAAVATQTSNKNVQRKNVGKKKPTDTIKYKNVLNEILDMRATRKMEQFLDGCCVYLAGFELDEKEKLKKLLLASGAIKYDILNEDVTHIIIGELNVEEYQQWKNDGISTNIEIVHLEWLLESIKMKKMVNEIVFRVTLPAKCNSSAPSPSSKRALRSMTQSFKQPEKPNPIKKKLFDKKSTKTKDKEIDDVTLIKPIASSTEYPLIDEYLSQYNNDNKSANYNATLTAPQLSGQSNEYSCEITLAPPIVPINNLGADNVDIIKTPKTKEQLQNITEFMPTTSSTMHMQQKQQQQQQQRLQQNKLTNQTTIDTAMNTIDYESLDCFRGISVYIDNQHFPEEFYTQIIGECEAAQGNVVTSNYRDAVDYAIVSFERTIDENKLPVKARHIITELYVETCLKQNKLVPIEYYHKYIPKTADSQPLQGMTIVISTYTELEKDFIESIAQLLGAQVNSTYVKKERPLLVCPEPKGSKYMGAIKWGYPIVTSDWLVDCADKGVKLRYTKYLVGDSPSDFSNSPTNNRITTTTITTSTTATATTTSTTATATTVSTSTTPKQNELMSLSIDENMNDDATEFTPLRNRRVSELAGGRQSLIMSNQNQQNIYTDSPHTPTNSYSKPSYNIEFMERILSEITNEGERECLREIILDIRNNQTPELERMRRQACTPINRKLPTPKGIPEFCTTPEFEKRLADEMEKRWRLPTKKLKPNTPIDELRRRVLKATAKAMGIACSDDEEDMPGLFNNDDNVNNDDDGDVRTEPLRKRPISIFNNTGIDGCDNNLNASSQKRNSTNHLHETSVKNVTTPPYNSISKSHTKNLSNARNSMNTMDTMDGMDAVYVPETQSPNNFDNQKEQSTNISNMGQHASFDKRSTINFDQINFEDTSCDGDGDGPSTSKRSTDIANSSPEVKQITDYLKNCESRRQSMKKSAATRRGGSGNGGAGNSEFSSRGNANIADDHMMLETEVHYVQPFESEQFGIGSEQMVEWRDPCEFDIERRTKAKTTKMQFIGKPRFSISYTYDDEREDVINKIHKLGGEISENLVNYDPLSTHFLCARPNRGEKMLGSISAGKWILSLKYIEECYAKDAFVDEELYEWGNCKALNLPQLTDDEQIIAKSAHRWRKELSDLTMKNGGVATGAFDGTRAILHLPERNINALKKVFNAGKGEVINANSPYSRKNSAHLATHCFVDVKKMPLSKEDYEFLREHNVQIYSQMYINSYLMNGRDADFTKYEIKL